MLDIHIIHPPLLHFVSRSGSRQHFKFTGNSALASATIRFFSDKGTLFYHFLFLSGFCHARRWSRGGRRVRAKAQQVGQRRRCKKDKRKIGPACRLSRRLIANSQKARRVYAAPSLSSPSLFRRLISQLTDNALGRAKHTRASADNRLPARSEDGRVYFLLWHDLISLRVGKLFLAKMKADLPCG